MAIFFHDEKIKSRLRNKTSTKMWLREVLQLEGKAEGEIHIVLMSDEELLAINQEYLSRDYYTDIITFDNSSGSEISGDLFISIERVEENGEIYGTGKEMEVNRVIVHGILHLIGYSDHTPDEKKLMRDKEDQYLGLL